MTALSTPPAAGRRLDRRKAFRDSVLLGLALVGFAGALGWISAGQAEVAVLGALVIVAIGAAAQDILLPAVLTVPFTMCVVRLTGSGSGLSASDFVLFFGTLSALMMLRTAGCAEVRNLLWTVVFYQAALIPTLIQNPYQANITEWVHELFLVGGSIVVGFVVGRSGRASQAMTMYLIVASAIAVWACIEAPASGFSPVYLPSYHKNVIGDMTAFAVIIAYARPPWLKWTRQWATVVIFVCGFGMLASQSKQAILGAAAGVVIISVRRGQAGQRSKLILMSILPLLVFAYSVTQSQLKSSNQYNAVHQRFTFYDQSFAIWDHGRWLGVGLRWWYTFRFEYNFQPPNAELEMLTSTGIVGLAAFLIFTAVSIRLLARVDPRYGTLAVAIIVARFVQGQFDLFWVTAQSSLPWLVVGLTLGAFALARANGSGEPSRQDVDLVGDHFPDRRRMPDRVVDVAVRAPSH